MRPSCPTAQPKVVECEARALKDLSPQNMPRSLFALLIIHFDFEDPATCASHPSLLLAPEHRRFASLPSALDSSQTPIPQKQRCPVPTHPQSNAPDAAAAQALATQNHAPPLPQTLPAPAPCALPDSPHRATASPPPSTVADTGDAPSSTRLTAYLALLGAPSSRCRSSTKYATSLINFC